MKVREGEDGKTEYILHQSTINTFLKCPEQARREMLGELPDDTTDAAAIGTAMHAGIEWVLKGGAVSSVPWAIESVYMREHDAGIRYVQTKTPKTAIAKAMHCWQQWYDHVLHLLPEPELIEHRFEVVLAEHDDYRIILRGTIDMVDVFDGIWDWKTANQPYEQWQLQRFYVQPTVYTYALAHMRDAELTGGDWWFTYAVMPKVADRHPQVLPVTRNAGHWDWLRHQCERIVDLMRADLDQWPLNDNGWWCSPKWCLAYDDCKGVYVEIKVA